MRRSILLALAALLVAGLAVGAAPAAAQDSGDQTTAEADLLIDQPTYIDEEVRVERDNGTRIYHVNGDSLDIWLQSVDHRNVTSAGIADGSGDLEYRADRDLYRFRPANNGTMTLFWEVERENSSQRLEAIIRVDQTEYVHRTQDEDDEMAAAADNWRSLEDEVENEFPDRSTNDVVSSALTKEIFFASPFSSFLGDIQGIVLLLTLTPGGLFLLGLFLFAFLGSSYGLMRGYNRLKKQTRDEHELDREKFEIQKSKTEKIMQQVDFNERLPDETSERLRTLLSENPWLASKKIMQMWSPTQVKGTVLQLMGQAGYVGIDDDDGARIVRESDVDGEKLTDLTALDNGDEDDRGFIQRVRGEDLDLTVMDEPDKLDLSAVSLPIDNRDVSDDDLIAELEPRFPEDFESEAHMAAAMGKTMELVANHPEYTTDEGHTREEMDLLSFNSEIATTLADEADFPPAHVYKRLFVTIADQLDSEAKLDQQLNDLQNDGTLGGD